MYNAGKWNAGVDKSFELAKQATKALNLEGVDVMSWWCAYGQDDVVGMATLGGLCTDSNVNINKAMPLSPTIPLSSARSGFVSKYLSNCMRIFIKLRL